MRIPRLWLKHPDEGEESASLGCSTYVWWIRHKCAMYSSRSFAGTCSNKWGSAPTHRCVELSGPTWIRTAGVSMVVSAARIIISYVPLILFLNPYIHNFLTNLSACSNWNVIFVPARTAWIYKLCIFTILYILYMHFFCHICVSFRTEYMCPSKQKCLAHLHFVAAVVAALLL